MRNAPSDYDKRKLIEFLGEEMWVYSKRVNGRDYWWSSPRGKWILDSVSGLLP